jgi:hypothetical protein
MSPVSTPAAVPADEMDLLKPLLHLSAIGDYPLSEKFRVSRRDRQRRGLLTIKSRCSIFDPLLAKLRKSAAHRSTRNLNQPLERRVHLQDQEDRGSNRERA